jgi:transposase
VSPYDTEARYRGRHATVWTGYVAHLSETCDDDTVHLITHAMTTDASVNEVRCTAAIQRALAGEGLAPSEHLVDAAYVDAGLLVRSREELGIALVGPPRSDASWQAKLGDGYGLERFQVDWERERVRCPQGRLSSAWSPLVERSGRSYVRVLFRKSDCSTCPAQPLCTRAKHRTRYLKLQPRAEHEALKAGRERLATKEGRRAYARRAGVEGRAPARGVGAPVLSSGPSSL